MIILQANKIERSFAGDVLFENINLQVDERDRIALVGKMVLGSLLCSRYWLEKRSQPLVKSIRKKDIFPSLI